MKREHKLYGIPNNEFDKKAHLGAVNLGESQMIQDS